MSEFDNWLDGILAEIIRLNLRVDELTRELKTEKKKYRKLQESLGRILATDKTYEEESEMPDDESGRACLHRLERM
jgi:hypothetical protein